MDDDQKMNGAEDCSYGWMHVLKAVMDFLGIFAASFLVGSIMGCITALLTKFTHIRAHPMLESTLLVLMSYSTFLLAEVVSYNKFLVHQCQALVRKLLIF